MNIVPFKTNQNTILRRVAAGDETAVNDCINQYGNLIWALAKKFTPKQEDAEMPFRKFLWRSGKMPAAMIRVNPRK